MLQIKSKKLLLGICFFALFTLTSFGQANGDYQTAASGDWSSPATWQKRVLGAWAAAGANPAPTSADLVITILSGHTVTVTANVTVDQVTVATGGTLIINTTKTITIANSGVVGTDLIVVGTLINHGSFTINASATISYSAGGTYKHCFDSTKPIVGIIPIAAWAATSNCEIDSCGNTGGGPTGLNTATAPGFGNFTWNNTTQTVDIFLLGLLTTVNGNLTCTSTNASKLILKSTGAGASTTVSGSFLMSGGNLVLAQIPALVTNYLLSIGTSFTQNGGTLTIANCSGTLGGFTGNGTLTVGTSSSITNGTLNVCSSTWVGPGGTGTFNATGVGGLSISGTGVVNGCSSSAAASTGSFGTIATTTLGVSAGATLNLNTSTTTGGGGSTTLNSSGLITINGGTINGSGATGTGITGCSSTINANLGLTISSGTLNLTPGSITGGGGNGTINVSGGPLTISGGTLNINSSTATAGTAGSNGIISVTGGAACSISGAPIINITSSTTTGGGGCGTLSVTGAITSDFSMTGGTFNLCSTSGAGTGNGTLDIDDACTISGGTFSLTSSATTSLTTGKGIMTVGGNFSHTTAAASFTRTTTLATATGTITIDGSIAQTIESTNGFTGTNIIFNITQTAVLAAKTTVPTAKTFTVNTGTTFNVNDNSANTGYDLQVVGTGLLKVSGIMNVTTAAVLDLLGNVITDASTGAGTFNLISDAGLITQHADGITTLASGAVGCIRVTGARSYSTGADYTYNSAAVAQVTGNGLPTSLIGSSNLTINNSFFTPLVLATTGVTLSQATTTVGTLTLTKGKLNTTATNLLTLGAAATSSPGFMTTQTNYSFVDGPIKKIGNSSFVFPTGDAYIATGSVNTVKWARIEITAPTNPSDEFTAEYHKINDPCDVNQAVSNSVTGLNHVSYKEYWDLNRVTAAASAPTVTLYWEDGNEGTSLGSAISSPTTANLTVAEFYSATWNNLGASSVTGGVAYAPGKVLASLAGTFTTNTIMNFTFGAPTAVNPLPIELLTFNGYSASIGNQIYWSTATETNNNYFDLERSTNGSEFTKITSLNGAGNSTSTKNYEYLDKNPLNSINYYRLRQVDYNGEFSYSTIITIDNTNDENASVQVYPNPSNDVVNIVSSENIASYTVYNAIGEIVYTNASEQQHIQFNPLSKGIYIINAISKQGKTITTRFVKN